ncbi:hypothetical protein PInf_009795 [Phytophthora infestans]|nr:hypothetical protein PInf_009795 [Phytophthora infestans]
MRSERGRSSARKDGSLLGPKTWPEVSGELPLVLGKVLAFSVSSLAGDTMLWTHYATYTSVPRRGGAPSVEPLPHRELPGARPTVPASSTLSPWALRYLDMELTDAGVKKCFERLLSMTLPKLAGEIIVRTTLEGLQAYFDYSNPDHPYQQLWRLYPLQACLFDTINFDPSIPISKRAPIETRLKMIWANLRGDGGKQVSWYRGGLVEEPKKVAHDKELLKVLRALLKKRFSERDRRADRLRNKYREQYMAWSHDSPWRTGWMNASHQHPYSTTYFPCQCNTEFFNPRGTHFVDVYRSVVVDPALAPPELIPTWRDLFDSPPFTPRPALTASPAEAGAEGSQAPDATPAAEVQLPDEEEKESGDSTSLTLLAAAAR